MTDAEVEAVARALFQSENRDIDRWPWESECADTELREYWMQSARAAIAAMPGREWLPIETAPTKQFTKALIYDGSAAYVGQLVNGRWLLSWNHEDPNPDDVDRPTHWQPLPDPPKG